MKLEIQYSVKCTTNGYSVATQLNTYYYKQATQSMSLAQIARPAKLINVEVENDCFARLSISFQTIFPVLYKAKPLHFRLWSLCIATTSQPAHFISDYGPCVVPWPVITTVQCL